jgi:hypothetical protein
MNKYISINSYQLIHRLYNYRPAHFAYLPSYPSIMKTSPIFAAAAALLLHSPSAQATPVAALVARQKSNILLSFLKFFGGLFPEAEATW